MDRLTKKDADTFRAFFTLVRKGKFEVQGEAIVQMGNLFQWASTLEKKIEATILEIEKPSRKDLGGTDAV